MKDFTVSVPYLPGDNIDIDGKSYTVISMQIYFDSNLTYSTIRYYLSSGCYVSFKV